MPNDIDALRQHLFETLSALKDKTNPMELDRAKAVADVARVIVDSAKVEVHFLKVTGGVKSTNFLPDGDDHVPTQEQPPRTAAADTVIDHFQITIDALEAKRDVIDRAIASLKQLQASETVTVPAEIARVILPPQPSVQKRAKPKVEAAAPPPVSALQPFPDAIEISELERELLEALQGGPQPRGALAARVKRDDRIVSDTLNEMAEQLLVRRVGGGPRNRKWHALVAMPISQPESALEEP